MAILVGFAIAIFLLFGAVIELFRDMEQVRQMTGVIDSPVSLEIDLPKPLPEGVGLPGEFLRQDQGLVLVLSDHCSTCGAIAEHLGGSLPASTWLLFVPQSVESGNEWLSRFGLASERKLFVDILSKASTALGVNLTPAVLRIRGGMVVAAHTLPSGRRLDDELAWLASHSSQATHTKAEDGKIWEPQEGTTGDMEVLL